MNSTNIGGYYEISSYNSIFFMDIFFEEKIDGKKAKRFAESILRKSHIRAKIYPSKDFVTNASLGDTIELPLHLKFRDKNRTCFF